MAFLEKNTVDKPATCIKIICTFHVCIFAFLVYSSYKCFCKHTVKMVCFVFVNYFIKDITVKMFLCRLKSSGVNFCSKFNNTKFNLSPIKCLQMYIPVLLLYWVFSLSLGIYTGKEIYYCKYILHIVSFS